MNRTTLDLARPRRRRTDLLRGLATLPLSLGAIAIASVPAYAHTDLKSSTPASGARLKVAPAIVVLEFSEDIDPSFATVVVTRAEGEPERLDLAPRDATTEIRAALPSAKPSSDETRWRIDYRVTSVDGHPVQGDFSFTVSSATKEPTPSATDPSASASPGGPAVSGIPEGRGDAEPTPASEPRAEESLSGSQRWLFVSLFLAVLVLAPALVLTRQYRHGKRPPPPRDRS